MAVKHTAKHRHLARDLSSVGHPHIAEQGRYISRYRNIFANKNIAMKGSQLAGRGTADINIAIETSDIGHLLLRFNADVVIELSDLGGSLGPREQAENENDEEVKKEMAGNPSDHGCLLRA